MITRQDILLAGALLAVFLAAPAAAYDNAGGESEGMQSASSLGARAAYYRLADSDSGAWAPGVVLRVRAAPAYVLEGSADFARYSSMGTKVHVTPIQATLIGYFTPESRLSAYLLLGGGWYPTRADGPSSNSFPRFGPHAGAGLQLLLGGNWSLDGSYRYLWTEVIRLSDPQHIFGRNFRDRGHMFTVALSYRL